MVGWQGGRNSFGGVGRELRGRRARNQPAVAMHDHAVVEEDSAAKAGLTFGVGVRSESSSPGDIAVAVGVKGVAAFRENPARAGVGFAQGEEVGGDVRLIFGEMFFRIGE